MQAEEAKIKAERGRVKGSLTRLENSSEVVNSKNDIFTRLQRLEEIFKEFERLDNLLEENESEIGEFEERYFALKAKFQNKLDGLMSIQQVENNFQNISQCSQKENQSVRLPKINIQIFSGKFTEWTSFRDMFIATVHSQTNLSNIQKLQYLKGLLAEEPALLIKHIPLSNASYKEAWDKLMDRYDKKKQIVQSLIKVFIDQKSILNPNSNNLRNLLNTSDEVIRGLKATSDEATSRDPWLIYLLLQKLDTETRKQWASHSAEIELPTIKEFFEFLNVRCSSLELFTNNEDVRPKVSSYVGSKNKIDKSFKLCIKCNGMHPIYRCEKFKGMDIAARKNFVKSNNLCFLCLNSHKVKMCPNSNLKCSRCQNKHNTLIHEDLKGNVYSAKVENESLSPSTGKDNDSELNLDEAKISSSASYNSAKCISFLPTAEVLVYNSVGKAFPFKALLDSGSESSFLSENAVNILGLKRKNDRISLNGIAGVSAGQTRGSVNLTIGSKLSNESLTIHAYILQRVTSYLPTESLDVKNLEHLKNIRLADENFMQPKECDIILGSDYFFHIIRPGKIVGNENQPIAQNTVFGWVVAGKVQSDIISPTVHSHFISKENKENECNVDVILQKFWQTEEVNIKRQHLTDEEEFCELHFQSTFNVNEEGRFVVKLPVYKDLNHLGNTKGMAISRLHAMERKFQKDKRFEQDYKQFMTEYEELGHMTPIVKNSKSVEDKFYYLPHHSVTKGDSISTKLRVVYDASCGADGSSLNSVLGTGPVLQRDIFSILVDFRTHKIAYSADIEKMYRQILIAPEDQNLQRIVWRSLPQEEMIDYKLNTVTYGTSSAPFLATRCLYQVGKELERDDPVVSSIIKEAFYMDDLLSGANSSEEAIEVTERLSEILEGKGFHLRKWRSNSSDVLEQFSLNPVELSTLEIHPDDCSKTLGLAWDSSNDCFIFKVNFKFDDDITKRTFLSQSAKLYDPLGFLSPCTVSIKIFFQQLWLMKLDWDTPLPEMFKAKWQMFQREFEQICFIRIPRWIQSMSKELILHAFCDASEVAYAAVIYAVQPHENSSKVTMLVAKTKVAPLKSVSIPRLELNAALLLSRLYSRIVNILSSYDVKFYAWSDSQVVLSWLSSHPRCWKPYIANRTAEILDSVSIDCWRYVPTKQNPADVASRGLSPNQLLECSLWWEGPPFLRLSEDNWPEQPTKLNTNADNSVNKERKNTKVCFFVTKRNIILDYLFEQFSSFFKIIDVLAFCFRFIGNCKLSLEGSNKNTKSTGKFFPLSPAERRHASNVIICYVQLIYFEDEINCIKSERPISSKSCLSGLHPFIDEDGLLRVRGRLGNSSLSYNAKYPIILPSQHEISILIVNYFHILYLHAGLNVLLGIIRQTYWIIGVKRIIKSCVHKCVKCCRYRSTSAKQLMGDLPPDRVSPSRPFSACGIDYAGPVSILKHRGRGAKTTKGYIAFFICFSTKALHLELVSDLTSEAFIASLKRFCARRGAPHSIYSDNGTSFVGAKRILSNLYKFLSQINRDDKICYFLNQMNLQWHMIPPVSPHFGGLWEASVRSAKFHLKRVIGNTNLTFEELSTLLTQIEAVLNSRPLTEVNGNDPDALDILTPSHFLIGDIITNPAEIINEERLSLRSRWDMIQKMKLTFWKKWRVDYLSSLQNRKKWKVSKENFKVNDVVILKEDNVPPSVWPLGKIVAVHPGTDNMVRVVTVKTAKGLFKRPIVKLCLLPVHQE